MTNRDATLTPGGAAMTYDIDRHRQHNADLVALIKAHVPESEHKAALALLVDLENDGYALADAELRKLYDALIETYPEEVAGIRDAFESTVFAPHHWQSAEWRQWLQPEPAR